MTIQVVGAGLYRTGTKSLKAALERLLGKPCYHMIEVFQHPEHIPTWTAAGEGRMPDWSRFLADYAATLDAPAAYFWPELAKAYPDALVLLSSRSAESWWRSASATVLKTVGAVTPEWDRMNEACGARFPTNVDSKAAALRGFELHNQRVREAIAPDRLLEWTIGDGWGPICERLQLPVPDEPFPHTNSTEEWRARERGQ